MENRDYGVGFFDIDGERVGEGVIGYSWDVAFVVFERHITELGADEVDPRDSLDEGAQWRRRGVGSRGRGICEEEGRVRRALTVHADRLRRGSRLPAAR